MADRYMAPGEQDVSTPTPGDTSLSLNGVTTTRGRIQEFVLSTGGTPADNAIQWLIRRFTASGTGSAVTPSEADLDGPPALITCEENHSAEPTYTTDLFDQEINQRAAYRHVMSPGFEWLVPAAADSGIGWCVIHPSYAGNAKVTAYWLE